MNGEKEKEVQVSATEDLLSQILEELKALKTAVVNTGTFHLPVLKELEVKNMTVNLGRKKRFDKLGNPNPDYRE